MAAKGHPANKGGGWIAKSVRRAIYKRDGNRCIWCGRKEDEVRMLTLDHVVPYSQDPTKAKDLQNLVTACHSCNSRRGNMGVFDFAMMVESLTRSAIDITEEVYSQAAQPLPQIALDR